MAVNLILLKKDGGKKSFHLPKSTTIVGRRHDCHLKIPLMAVSRKHCQLSYKNGVMKIRDLDSRNGIKVNDKKIEEAVIQAGDYIKIGPLSFLLQINGKPQDLKRSAEETGDASEEDTVAIDSISENDEELGELPSLDEDDLDSLLEETDSEEQKE